MEDAEPPSAKAARPGLEGRNPEGAMISSLFDLHPTHNPHRWYLPITTEMSAGKTEACFMFGGVGLAAAISALERTCNQPVIWATARCWSNSAFFF